MGQKVDGKKNVEWDKKGYRKNSNNKNVEKTKRRIVNNDKST